MNVSIIIGILIIAFGTGVMAYGFSNIAGILLTAFGTGIMIYGQLVRSKVDSAEVSQVLHDKVDSVLKRIEEVREGEKDKASAGKIQQIEQEFQTWAAEFLKDREQRKVELQRTQLDSVDVQLRVSNEWKPVFEYVLKTIAAMAHAYNSESGETIEVDFPPLPSNLYSEEARNYGGKVVFPNKVLWRVAFLSSKPARQEAPPSMYVDFKIEGDRDCLNSYFSITNLDGKSFRSYIIGPNVPTAKGVEGIYQLDSYRDSLKTVIRSLFEAQLLRD